MTPAHGPSYGPASPGAADALDDEAAGPLPEETGAGRCAAVGFVRSPHPTLATLAIAASPRQADAVTVSQEGRDRVRGVKSA